jgi:ribonuclease HI
LTLKDASSRTLKWAGTPISYSDGSAKDGHAGAGVIVPQRDGSFLSILVHVGLGSSLCAELTALNYLFKHTSRDEPLYAASDCLVAMQAILKGTIDRQSMNGHAEEDILRQCVRNIMKRKAHTHLIKVKAHVGISGNEQADKVAEKARKASMPERNAGSTGSVELELYISTDGRVLTKLCIAKNLSMQPKIKVANTQGLPMKKAQIHEAFVAKARREVLEAEKERQIKVANGTSTDGPSVAVGWVTVAQTEAYLNPVSFGFDKIRLKDRCARDFNRGKMMQGSRYHGKKCPLPGCNLKIENRFHFRSGCV